VILTVLAILVVLHFGHGNVIEIMINENDQRWSSLLLSLLVALTCLLLYPVGRGVAKHRAAHERGHLNFQRMPILLLLILLAPLAFAIVFFTICSLSLVIPG
jgi:hypothetical protein